MMKTGAKIGPYRTYSFLSFQGNYSNKELSDNFDSKQTFVGLIIGIISSIESFILTDIVFNILAENCYNHNFCISRTITLTRNRPKTLKPAHFCRPYHKDHFSNRKFHSIYHSFQNIG